MALPSQRGLEDAITEWVVDLEATHEARTAHEYLLVAEAQWVPRWRSLGQVTSAAIGDYQRERLREVVKETVRKHMVALRTFLTYCCERGWIDVVPTFPPLPRRATGTRKIAHAPRVPLTPAQAKRVLAALPEWSSAERRSKEQRYRVRARARFLYETALRPATIAKLSRPEHWRPGWRTLNITADVDKARKARVVPLSRAALAAIARCAAADGLIFGEHEIEDYLEAAGKKVLGRRVWTYDLKHSRITTMLRAGADIVGVSQLTGVSVKTLMRYVHPDEAAARKALGSVA